MSEFQINPLKKSNAKLQVDLSQDKLNPSRGMKPMYRKNQHLQVERLVKVELILKIQIVD